MSIAGETLNIAYQGLLIWSFIGWQLTKCKYQISSKLSESIEIIPFDNIEGHLKQLAKETKPQNTILTL